MSPSTEIRQFLRQQQTRRVFLGRASQGLGALALGSILQPRLLQAAATRAVQGAVNPLHFPAKARRVIWLSMAGGPSHLETFDPKPKLVEMHGKPMPESFTRGKQIAQLQGQKLVCYGPQLPFKRFGKAGVELCELFTQLGSVSDDICWVRSMTSEAINHDPAHMFMNTGSQIAGRPSMGSWVTYGLGTESRNLPGFVVLQSGPRGPRGGSVNWGTGFLPTTFQGVPFRGQGDPILNLTNPAGVSATRQRQTLDALRDLNLQQAVATGDAEIHTRIAAYEMASRMQSSAPELVDLRGESAATRELYGIHDDAPSFARNCLLARRLVERGSRFVQLYHTNWDSHGGPGENLQSDFEARCREVDQAQAALVTDLKQRGLLKDTLVIWGGEFGRTPMGENRDTTGRNHHIDAFTMWFAGGGTPAGRIIGETDELGFNAVKHRAHVHDLHATILHLLGLDHRRLTFRFQGRDFRLTDVHGNLIESLIA